MYLLAKEGIIVAKKRADDTKYWNTNNKKAISKSKAKKNKNKTKKLLEI